MYMMPNCIEVFEKLGPQAKKIPHCAVKFDVGERVELCTKVYIAKRNRFTLCYVLNAKFLDMLMPDPVLIPSTTEFFQPCMPVGKIF